MYAHGGCPQLSSPPFSHHWVLNPVGKFFVQTSCSFQFLILWFTIGGSPLPIISAARVSSCVLLRRLSLVLCIVLHFTKYVTSFIKIRQDYIHSLISCKLKQIDEKSSSLSRFTRPYIVYTFLEVPPISFTTNGEKHLRASILEIIWLHIILV